jgi:hypothetical protein
MTADSPIYTQRYVFLSNEDNKLMIFKGIIRGESVSLPTQSVCTISVIVLIKGGRKFTSPPVNVQYSFVPFAGLAIKIRLTHRPITN